MRHMRMENGRIVKNIYQYLNISSSSIIINIRMNINIQVDQSVFNGQRTLNDNRIAQGDVGQANQNRNDVSVSFANSSSPGGNGQRIQKEMHLGDFNRSKIEMGSFINRTTIAVEQASTQRNGQQGYFPPGYVDNQNSINQPQTERISFNVTITNLGGNRFHSNIDIQNELIPHNYAANQVKSSSLQEHSQSKKFAAKVNRQVVAFYKNDKYDRKSLYIFNIQWRCRQWVIELVRGKTFTYFMLLSILGNSISMSLTNYSDDENTTFTNQVLDKVDQAFTGVYTAEAVLKIIAFGFVFHKKSYMRDPWNLLDFTVVIIGLISLIPNVPNLKSLRTMRVLRPLRSINAVPSMKRLISTLLSSLPQMGYLVTFMMYFIAVFSIMGIQFFARDIYHRCRLTDEPFQVADQLFWPIDETQQRCCGGYYECASGTYCHALFERGLPLELDNVQSWDFIQFGFFQFDNMGTAMLQVFRVMALEGWGNVLYMYMDSSGVEAVIYFTLLVILGSFFMLTLFLAVIMNTFTKMSIVKANELDVKIKKKQAKKKVDHAPINIQSLNHHNFEESSSRLLGGKSNTRVKSTFQSIHQKKIGQSFKEAPEQNQSTLKNDVEVKPKTIRKPIQDLFLALCTHRYFQFLIISVIVMNTLILGLDSYPIDIVLQGRLEMVNNAFFGIFFIEMIVKIVGLGPKSYVKDLYNTFDAFIVLLSIADVVLTQALPKGLVGSGGGAISVFRTFRLLRVFKLVKQLKKLQALLKTMMRSLADIGSFVVLLFLLIFIYLLIGLEIFAIKPSTVFYASNFEHTRVNFDSFINGLIVLFVALTGENWDETMFHFALQVGWTSIIYFISFLIIGQMIFMNLFLAIVLNNFDITEMHDDAKAHLKIKQNPLIEKLTKLFQQCANVFLKCISAIEAKEPETQSDSVQEDGQLYLENSPKESPMIKLKTNITRTQALVDIKQLIEDQESPPKINLRQTQQDDSPLSPPTLQLNLANVECQSEENTSQQQSSGSNQQKKKIQKRSFSDSSSVRSIGRSPSSGFSSSSLFQRAKSFSEIVAKPKIPEQPLCIGNSLFCLTSKNKVRNQIARFISHQYFERFILLIILISSILLAFENPLNDPNSLTVSVLTYSDYILTSFFTLEAVFKIIVYGFILNGAYSYTRSAWNLIDFTVVSLSIVSLCLTSGRFESVKIFRLLRVLRPLRVISRNKGLKIGIQALFMAIPSLISVILITLFAFVIFGTIGVNFLKGTFYSCFADPSFAQTIQDSITINVVTYYDCLNNGGEWINADLNFDNLLSAMLALFNIATINGWYDILVNGIDSVGINMQPVENNNKYWFFYFLVTIIVCSFLIMNLFVGVVVSTFNSEREKLGKNFLLTENQKKWLEQKRLCMNVKPKIVIISYENEYRNIVRQIVMSQKFEVFIIVCITMNTVILCLDWYSQTDDVYSILNYLNYAFACIFGMEALLKLISLGHKAYLRDYGNVFDFVIVLLAIISSAISIPLHNNFGSRSTFIRALRLSKVLKYMKNADHIKVIIETFVVTLPALMNIGGLLCLFLYIYSVLGVFLFAEVQLQSELTDQANFQSFSIAFLTLLRCSTGEGWVPLMLDASRQFSIVFQCDTSDFSYDSYVANGRQTMKCGQGLGKIYFLTFYLMVPIIFLNLFIAIILQGFQQTSDKANILISSDDMDNFKESWAAFDQDGTGYIKVADIQKFLFKLGEPLGWSHEIYGNNAKLQDEFLVEMNIKTYNHFQDFLFYDVILALTKIRMVQKHIKTVEEKDMKKEQAERTRKMFIDKVQKSLMLNELDFDKNLSDNKLHVVHEVEESLQRETKLKRRFLDQEDTEYSSLHFKSRRLILRALDAFRRRRSERLMKESEEQKSIEIREDDESISEEQMDIEEDHEQNQPQSILIEPFHQEEEDEPVRIDLSALDEEDVMTILPRNRKQKRKFLSSNIHVDE